MIHQLTSDLTSFKPLSFGPGLNVILADKSPGASDLQSRNGAGKTSLVELVHFLFGADARAEQHFSVGGFAGLDVYRIGGHRRYDLLGVAEREDAEPNPSRCRPEGAVDGTERRIAYRTTGAVA